MDYASAYTYLPALSLFVSVFLISGLSCLLADGVAYLIILVYASNWIAVARLDKHWEALTRGIAVWLSWVAYGDIFARAAADDNVHDFGLLARSEKSVILSSLVLCAQFGYTAIGFACGQGSKGVDLLAAGICVLLALPLATSVFVELSCAEKIVKSCTFAALFGFFYVLESNRGDDRIRVFQRVTVAAMWPLMASMWVLPAAGAQILARLYTEGALEYFVADLPATQAEVDKAAAWERDIELAHTRAPDFDLKSSPHVPDIQRLIAMSANS
jgi:hypothetical protein